MWSTRSELDAALRNAGLGDWAPMLADAATYCILLVPGPIDESDGAAPLGACRLGGRPDLPPDIDWPLRPPVTVDETAGPVPASTLLGRWHWLHRLRRTPEWRRALQVWQERKQAERHVRNRDWPMSFVAQIDFTQINAMHALDGFPTVGRLSLFCDPFDWPTGPRQDQARVRVLYADLPAERLQRRQLPSQFDEPESRMLMPRGYAFKSRVLRPTVWLLPPPLSFAGQRRNWALPGWQGWPAYQQFWRDLYARYPGTFGSQGDMIHQVGGAAFSV